MIEGEDWKRFLPLILDGKEVLDCDMTPVARCATREMAELVSIAPQVIGLLYEMHRLYSAGRIIGEPTSWAMASQLLKRCGSYYFSGGYGGAPRDKVETPICEVSFACRLPAANIILDDFDQNDRYELGCELEAAAHALRYIEQIEPKEDPCGSWQAGITMMGMGLAILNNIYSQEE